MLLSFLFVSVSE